MTNFGRSILIAVIVLALLAGFLLFLMPSTPTPTSNPSPVDNNIVTLMPEKCGFTLISPIENSSVTTPLVIKAEVVHPEDALCNWTVFEAIAGRAELHEGGIDGAVIGVTNLQAEGEWMTNAKANFSGTLTFTVPAMPTAATLVITEDNPSDKPNPNSIWIPLTIE